MAIAPSSSLALLLLLVAASSRGAAAAPATAAAPLNALNFHGNVVEGDSAESWVVFFCVDWHGPCQELRDSFLRTAQQQATTLNAGRLFTDAVRFAEVDCAVDKVLCNQQLVEVYPTVAHYRGGERAASWVDEGRGYEKELKRLKAWLHRELRPDREEAPRREPSPAPQEVPPAAAARSALPNVAAALAATAWVLSQGADLLRTARAALRLLEGRGQAGKKAGAAPAAAAPAATGADRLAGALPKAWALGRGSMEL